MEFLDYISVVSIPLIIFVIILYGFLEKKKVFELFISGAKEGMKITVEIFPTLIGIFFAVGCLRSSGIIDGISNIFESVFKILKFPPDLLPLVLLRPISGSASIATAIDIIKKHGVDSEIGLIASVIMGATETTFYTIAVYTGFVKIKNTRFIFVAALIADIVGMATAIVVCRIMSMKSC